MRDLILVVSRTNGHQLSNVSDNRSVYQSCIVPCNICKKKAWISLYRSIQDTESCSVKSNLWSCYGDNQRFCGSSKQKPTHVVENMYDASGVCTVVNVWMGVRYILVGWMYDTYRLEECVILKSWMLCIHVWYLLARVMWGTQWLGWSWMCCPVLIGLRGTCTL